MNAEDLNQLRDEHAKRLQAEIAGMNPGNFLVRPHREHVDRFATFRTWEQRFGHEDFEAATTLAGLPSDYKPEEDRSIEARRFDLLALKLQLAVLKHDPGFDRLCDTAVDTASLLLDQTAIPAVAKERELLEAVADRDWWQDVTAPMLENMRKRLRGLVRLIDRTRRNPVYTDFEDPAGPLVEGLIVGAASSVDHKNFLAKVRTYLNTHADDPAVRKLLHNEQITSEDLDRLHEIFVAAGMATDEDLAHAAQQAGGLGLFLRALTGMDPDSVRAAFEDFCANRQLTVAQHDFLALLVEYMSKQGVMEVGDLYERPFSALAPSGPEKLFRDEELNTVVNIIRKFHDTAKTPDETHNHVANP